MEMNSCICNWKRDRKMSKSVTAGEAESVTAHEVINARLISPSRFTGLMHFAVENRISKREREKVSILGAHEHWNNPMDKKYSRNLGKMEGIELIQKIH
ncbi:hypothetical protein [Petralouisia muris]|nr:hypothetical protein [Petralouisia muris]